jgi:hypothetical protein
MAGKINGLGWTTCSLDDSGGSPQAIKNDVTNLTIGTPRAVQDVTGLDKSAIERILNLADGTVTLNYVMNVDATTSIFAVAATASSTSVQRTMTNTFSGKTLAMEMLLTDFPVTRSPAGELTGALPLVLANGAVPTWA